MIEKVKSRKLNMPMLEIVITLGILAIVSVFLLKPRQRISVRPVFWRKAQERP